MHWVVAAAVVVLPFGPVMARVAPAAGRKVRQRVERWGRRLRHGSKLTKVRGTVRPIQLVRSPMSGLDCTFAVTVFEARDYRRVGRILHVFTGKDFFADGEDSPTLVRVQGAVVRLSESTQLDMQLVRQPLPAAIQAAIDASPLAGAPALYWREVLFERPAVTVFGQLRTEQAPPDLLPAGHRDLAVFPTLSAVDGVLEILPKA